MQVSSDRVQRIRQKMSRGETLDLGEQLDWMDAQGAADDDVLDREAKENSLKMNDDEEDVEHHDVGLRRNALNILMIERGDMLGTAIPLGNDQEAVLREIVRIVNEVYAARRRDKKP